MATEKHYNAASPFGKRLNYLGLADFDYLSARLLLLSGLGTTGFPKAVEAVEKLLKLAWILSSFQDNKEVSEGMLKKIGHGIIKLVKLLRAEIPGFELDNSWDGYFKQLEVSYARRYPENWKVHQITVDVEKLDKLYCYLRNNIVSIMPNEDKERARQFGTFVYDAYRSEAVSGVIHHSKCFLPKEILELRNQSFQDFDIAFDAL